METGFVLNPLDIILAAIIIFGMYRGATKGLIKRGAILLAVGTSVILGFRLRWMSEILFKDYLHLQVNDQVMMVLTFILTFVVAYIVISAMLGYLTQGLAKLKLNIDNALGALFGGVVTTLGLSVILMLLSYANFPSGPNVQGSILYQPVASFARQTFGIGATVLQEANKVSNRIAGPKGPGAQAPAANQPPNQKPASIR
ncbi:CvpA family protein [Pontibacter sp. G13]|uniref:CvpA family protein n=1 Tax=Pontibacter sp. G13 TaxID=3074898 RepID=UPI00288A3F1F|nr:CvpA family protein [Pontibacter sp. G13]WNJ16497.1 CvpA family protein [Pontibacter sp. G13]